MATMTLHCPSCGKNVDPREAEKWCAWQECPFPIPVNVGDELHQILGDALRAGYTLRTRPKQEN